MPQFTGSAQQHRKLSFRLDKKNPSQQQNPMALRKNIATLIQRMTTCCSLLLQLLNWTL